MTTVETKQAQTVGVSPKVYLPTVALVLAAVVLFATGDTQTAVTLLLAAAGVGGVGGAAKPGTVRAKVD